MDQITFQAPEFIFTYALLAAGMFPISLIVLLRLRHRQKELVADHYSEIREHEKQKERTLNDLEKQHLSTVETTAEDYRKSLASLEREHSEVTRQLKIQHKDAVRRYSKIVDIEDEMRRLETDRSNRIEVIEAEIQKLVQRREGVQSEISELRLSYKSKREIYDRLKAEIAIFDDRLAFSELGVYEPHFDFGDSEEYKKAINDIRAEQKAMIKGQTAVFGMKDWTVDGSAAKGQPMINRSVRLTLRAFNTEWEAAISNTRWNNVQAMEKRIERAQTAIDKLNATYNVVITDAYLQAKLKELRLTHEYRERLKIERDERAELARQEREEKRLLQEAKKAEKEERQYQALLDKARSEAGVVSSEEHEAKIRDLEAQLLAAHEKSERAKAMAEQTKTGFVYIISNVGSFGEDVVKIGLTRRLDPADRVKELGDASVPFLFDTHAMIYSEEAPALEASLHNEFADKRVNAANMRKEFFRVTIAEVEDAVRRLSPTSDFHTDIEAQEYYETLARRKALAESLATREASELPREI